MKNNTQNVLITGSTGYIGYNLTQYLVKKGFVVHLLIRNTSILRDLGNLQNAFIHYYNGNIKSIEDIFNKHDVNFVYHLATVNSKSDDFIILEELEEVCLRLTNQLYKVAIKHNNFLGFINVGTVWQSHENYSNLYSMYKMFQEEIGKYFSLKYSIKVISLLLTDSYGSGDWRPKFLNQLKKSYQNGKNLSIINPCNTTDLTHVDDICEALYMSMEFLKNTNSYFSKYRIQGNATLKIRELVDLCEKIIDCPLNVSYGEVDKISSAVIREKVEILPGWKSEVDLNEGLIKFFLGEEQIK